MSSVRIVAMLSLLMPSSGCAMLSRQPDMALAPMPGQLEPIHAAAFTRDLAVFWVSSNGCTEKADLTPVVDRVGDGSTITLRRIDQDDCDQPVDNGVEIIWSFEELGLEPGASVSVNNPYQLPPS